MQNINNFYKFVSEDETMANFQRKYGIHNTSALAHNRRHRKHALTHPSVGGIIDEPIEIEPAYTTLMTRDYCGNYIYSNGELERILTDNGYIQDGEYYFYIKDYQGNIRVVLNQNNQPVELNSYYPYGTLMAATTTEGNQPYKYSAKELDRENGLDLYDSQARHYDPIISRTTTIDPLAEKYYSLSPYTWCAANPLRYIDIDGRRPTLIEAALMAKAAYGESVKLKGGWSMYSSGENKSGLKYAVFSRSINDKTEYTVATAGTDLTSIKDWENNITQLFGKSKQYAESVGLAYKFIEEHEGEEVTFVGHSLGGGLAAANALYTNREAITFNSAYLSKSTISAFNFDLSRGKRITNYTVNGEILADIQSSMNNLVRIGKQINLNYSNSVGEQILSKCLNVILPSTIAGTELIDKVKRHSIDTVINAIK